MASGIYLIIGPKSKVYIGSAADFNARWRSHISTLNGKRHANKHLQNSWDAHHGEGFSFHILEEVENLDNLLAMEQVYIDAAFGAFARDKIYNIHLIAGSHRGCEPAEDTRKRIASTKSGKKVYTFTSPDGVVYDNVESIRTFAKEHGLNKTGLRNVVTGFGGTRHHKGWTGYLKSAENPDVVCGPPPRQPRKRFKRSEENKDQVALTKSGGKRYTIVSHDQTVYTYIANLTGFSKKHNLNFPHLLATSTGACPHAKGWIAFVEPPDKSDYDALLEKTLEKSKSIKLESVYTIISPDGTIYPDVVRLTDFAKAHSLTTSALCVTLNGKRPHHKGWTGYIQS